MATHATQQLPKAGDKFQCKVCGMEIKVEKDCHCQQGKPRMECCNQTLTKV